MEGEASDAIIAEITEGLLRGTTMNTFHGRCFFAFRGIRYAEPPIGALRFKPPVPIAPWDEIRDAKVEGPPCPQIQSVTGQYVGDEDCLFLNVYTHQNAKSNPVIVWIHGGAFYEGHGGVALGGPDFLMDHDIVLVTFNYRLGPLGFLSTGDSEIPGNYGLKDAVEVLRWVQRNIEVFGGNPKSVTVFGYSSGAACAHYLTLSPLSEGLFHKVIFQSGSAIHQWAFHSSPFTTARKVAEVLGCYTTTSSKHIAQFLSKVSAEDLVRTMTDFSSWGVGTLLPFAPVVETQEDRRDPPFLTEPPEVLLMKGLVHKIPAITGVTVDESVESAFRITQNPGLAKELDIRFDKTLLRGLKRNQISDNLMKEMRSFYLGSDQAKDAGLSQLITLLSDCTFNYNSYRAAVAHAKASGQPVFVYVFSFQGRLSTIVKDGVHHIPLGVAHADDLFYVFWRGIDFPDCGPNAEEKVTITRITTMLTNFALTGDPTPHTNDLITVKWNSMKGGKSAFQYLDIGSELCMHDGPFFPKRMAFWLSLLEKDDILI